jgi:hypothetical protein
MHQIFIEAKLLAQVGSEAKGANSRRASGSLRNGEVPSVAAINCRRIFLRQVHQILIEARLLLG